MLHRLLSALLVLSALSLAGCGLSPQQLNPQPVIKGAIVAVGQGQPVQVRVVDGRPSPVLGTRGGLYPETSTISVAGPTVLPKLQAQVEAAVRLMGFTPSPGAYNAPSLTVTLSSLTYQSPKDEAYVTEANISTVLGVDVQNGSRRYNGRYSASLNQRSGMAPNEETNNELVSEVLSDALTKLVRDPAIGSALLP
ncbi:YajG family lipoprotein [Pseudomonas sp. N040]|uniref:YajG family lipoprotein n=1 Tax=Pseudomonas sp. N040 TaxID=2785325 RepID=UPI0018A2AEA2|nr:YajG family lipoprotein [Pseudomonas sp. N040]MBF7730400.1 hypothetical protein [Pseudomonas sp. N040]MBW7014042.1 YajG family lipoprotein [Pseudomonas sp. N040]